MEPIAAKYRPMPNSKKKEMLTKALINSAIPIPPEIIPKTSKKPTLIVYSDEDDDETSSQSDVSDLSCASIENTHIDRTKPGSSTLVMLLPEPVDIEEDLESNVHLQISPEDVTDALEGADLFKDISVEPDQEDQQDEAGELSQEEADSKEEEETQNYEEKVQASVDLSSESSVDLTDLAFDFTREERRTIRRKRKMERQDAKRNQILLKKKREEELALAKKKDRFFDKSRIIPNEIYFGDIVVPLHVLHSYGQQPCDDRSTRSLNNVASCKTYGKSNIALFRVVKLNPSHSRLRSPLPNQLRRSPNYKNSRISMLKKYLSAAGVKQKEYRRSIKHCANDAEIINAMMRILRSHGLQGDPTIAKCRQLRKKHDETEDDTDELDTSLIINPNGRALRSGTTISQDADSQKTPDYPIEVQKSNEVTPTNTVIGDAEEPVQEPHIAE